LVARAVLCDLRALNPDFSLRVIADHLLAAWLVGPGRRRELLRAVPDEIARLHAIAGTREPVRSYHRLRAPPLLAATALLAAGSAFFQRFGHHIAPNVINRLLYYRAQHQSPGAGDAVAGYGRNGRA
jgi:hypothetical protein